MCIDRRTFLHSSALGLAGAIGSGSSLAGQAQPGHTHPASLMTESATRFLAALDTNQRAKATFPFTSEERSNWHFIPRDRKGLALRDMSPYQKHLASALLASGLSQSGYIKAVTIMSLEDVLRIIEHDTADLRNPEKYYFSIFGVPSDTETWGYRVEGHHLSQNYTVAYGNVIDGPSFFGANPAQVQEGPRKGLRTLAGEDDLALDLVRLLDEQQRRVAIVSATAYPEILTEASRKAALQRQPSGLDASSMNPTQFEALVALVEEYVSNLPDAFAGRRRAQLSKAGKSIHFAWAGGTSRRDKRYYRVQTPDFLIEFDDTQDDANHIHSVWRDFGGDFGEDLLQQHYRASHQRPLTVRS